MKFDLGSGWKTNTGIAIALVAYVLGAMGWVVPTYAAGGEAMGGLLALFGIQDKLTRMKG